MSGEYGPVEVFMSSTVNGESSTYISHRHVKSCGTEIGISYANASTGPDGKTCHFSGYESVSGNESALKELTSVSSIVFSILRYMIPSRSRNCELSPENKLILFLMKLKHGLSFAALGVIFGVHRTNASGIFIALLTTLFAATKHFIHWPPRYAVIATMPKSFKEVYPNFALPL